MEVDKDMHYMDLYGIKGHLGHMSQNESYGKAMLCSHLRARNVSCDLPDGRVHLVVAAIDGLSMAHMICQGL